MSCKERLGEFCILKSFPGKVGVEGRLRPPGRAAGPLGLSWLESGLTPGQVTSGSRSASVPGGCESLLWSWAQERDSLPPSYFLLNEKAFDPHSLLFTLPSFVCLKAEGLPAREVIK